MVHGITSSISLLCALIAWSLHTACVHTLPVYIIQDPTVASQLLAPRERRWRLFDNEFEDAEPMKRERRWRLFDDDFADFVQPASFAAEEGKGKRMSSFLLPLDLQGFNTYFQAETPVQRRQFPMVNFEK